MMLRHYSWRTKGPDLDDNIKITRNVQKNWKYFSVSYNTETMERYVNSSGLNTKYVFIWQSSWYSSAVEHRNPVMIWYTSGRKLKKDVTFGFERN